VADILPQAVPQLAGRLVEHTIRRQWPSLVGPEVARRTRPGALAGDCLQVVVDNSPWCHEITLRAPAILAALQSHLGPGAVGALRVTVGPLAPERPPVAPERRQRWSRPSAEGMLLIERVCAPITDHDLKESIRRLLVKTGQFSSQ
jgi:predicted nucleic acid-binding Zn ribbon protein